MKHFKPSEQPDFLRLDFHIPDASNALSMSAARELASLAKSFAKLKKPVLVCSLHPRMFCSGGNLSDYKKFKGKAPGLKINREIQKSLDAFGHWAVPKLAVIEGDVLGGGMEWLARFDFRWTTPQAYFSFWQRRIGLSSGWGGGRAWAEKICDDQIRRLMMEGRILGANESVSLGLVDRVVSAWKIREEAEAWASGMKGATINTLSRWKKADEAKIFSSLWMGNEHRNVLNKWKSPR